MTIIGFNIKKIEVEKLKELVGKISISNNISVKSIDQVEINIGKTKEIAAKFNFEFISKYDPEVAHIKISGNVMHLDTPKAIKELITNWTKKKEVSKKVMGDVMNHVLNKCNIQALILSREINLPPPIPLPKVQQK